MERFNTVDDFMGIQKSDLIPYMTFENAKPFLKDEYVSLVNEGEEIWTPLTDAKKEIIQYLSFAYEKAIGKRGLSAGRSMLHFKTWIWLDDPEFYDKIVHEIDNYYDYGLPVLDKISEKYGYVYVV